MRLKPTRKDKKGETTVTGRAGRSEVEEHVQGVVRRARTGRR